MRARTWLLAAALGVLATDALAQALPEPPALKLPVGARVRLRTQAAPGDWIKGTLAGADSGSDRARARRRAAGRPQPAPPPARDRDPARARHRQEAAVAARAW